MREYVCQLSDEEQEQFRKMLTGLLLYELGNKPENMEKLFGVTFEQVIQDGMDSKIFDVDHRTLAYLTMPIPQEYLLADKSVIAGILREAHGWSMERMQDYLEENQEEVWER